jgi:hypothetical protein
MVSLHLVTVLEICDLILCITSMLIEDPESYLTLYLNMIISKRPSLKAIFVLFCHMHIYNIMQYLILSFLYSVIELENKSVHPASLQPIIPSKRKRPNHSMSHSTSQPHRPALTLTSPITLTSPPSHLPHHRGGLKWSQSPTPVITLPPPSLSPL